MLDLLSKLISQSNLLSITIQISILGIDLFLINLRIKNGFIFLSITLVLSLFILQLINHRFRYLRPVNQFIMRGTADIDTRILKVFLYLASCSIIFALIINHTPLLKNIEGFLITYFVIIVISFTFFIPAFFWSIGVEFIQNRVTRALQSNPREYPNECPNCSSSNAYWKHEVLSQSKGKVTVKCNDCGHKDEWESDISIG